MKSSVFKGPKNSIRRPSPHKPIDHSEVITQHVGSGTERSKSVKTETKVFIPRFENRSPWERKSEEFFGASLPKPETERVHRESALSARGRKEND
jgi:hypothetical protein